VSARGSGDRSVDPSWGATGPVCVRRDDALVFGSSNWSIEASKSFSGMSASLCQSLLWFLEIPRPFNDIDAVSSGDRVVPWPPGFPKVGRPQIGTAVTS